MHIVFVQTQSPRKKFVLGCEKFLPGSASVLLGKTDILFSGALSVQYFGCASLVTTYRWIKKSNDVSSSVALNIYVCASDMLHMNPLVWVLSLIPLVWVLSHFALFRAAEPKITGAEPTVEP